MIMVSVSTTVGCVTAEMTVAIAAMKYCKCALIEVSQPTIYLYIIYNHAAMVLFRSVVLANINF